MSRRPSTNAHTVTAFATVATRATFSTTTAMTTISTGAASATRTSGTAEPAVAPLQQNCGCAGMHLS